MCSECVPSGLSLTALAVILTAVAFHLARLLTNSRSTPFTTSENAHTAAPVQRHFPDCDSAVRYGDNRYRQSFAGDIRTASNHERPDKNTQLF